MIGWAVFAIICLLFLIVFFTTIHIDIQYQRIDENDRLVFTFTAWHNLLTYIYEVPKLNVSVNQAGPELNVHVKDGNDKTGTKKSLDYPEAKRWYEKYLDFLARIHDVKPILQKMFKHIYCGKIEWHTQIGTGDAAETGALTGLVWGVKNMLLSVCTHYVTLRSIPRISVQPMWNNKCIQTEMNCIVHFRIGHAIVAGTRILLKLRKGRVRKWRTTPSRV